ncbi:hypothetical protein ACTWQF_10740 [Streptomyces sp. 8N114]|uniref:hypothetical protein n=1 Tax=Streptomyces sp. 8N114 TaxID=3457419 RepID=UPI003FD64AAB
MLSVRWRAVAASVAFGMLSGALSGCSSDEKDGDGHRKAADVRLKQPVKAPAPFDSRKGWQVTADWLPGMQPFPYAVSARSQTVAYLEREREGRESAYVLRARGAVGGKTRWTGKSWKAPALTGGQQPSAGPPGDAEPLTVPRVTLVSDGKREYFAVWAYGERAKDRLHETRDVVAVAFYKVRASGDAVAPISTATVPAPPEDPQVTAGESGLLIADPDGDDASSVDASSGRVTDVTDDIGPAGTADGDDAHPGGIPTASGLVASRGRGGFGLKHKWDSKKVTPPGVRAVYRKADVDINEGIYAGRPNGTIVDRAGRHLIAAWDPMDDDEADNAESLLAVHDTATGRVQATVKCPDGASFMTEEAEETAWQPPTHGVLSRNGRYLASGSLLFDLRSGKGRCVSLGEDAKTISLRSVMDDGTAYGVATSTSDNDVPVRVSAAEGKPHALPDSTRTPDQTAGSVGVFVHGGQDTARLTVLAPNNGS